MSRVKQIEEMVADISEKQNGGWKFVGDSEYTTDVYNEELAERLYNAGYRKQIEGEWIIKGNYFQRLVCTNCSGFGITMSRYCPNCGAKMKGGAE